MFSKNYTTSKLHRHSLRLIGLLMLGIFSSCGEFAKQEICDEENYYAGIEVSSTSIKKTILEINAEGEIKTISTAKTRQLNFGDNGEIDAGEMSQIIDELANQLESVERRCITKERIFIAFSSGILKLSGLDTLARHIVSKFEIPSRNLEKVNYHVEVTSGMLSLKHNFDPSSVFFVDVGGSNTKIGVFDKTNNTYVTEELDYGTRSLEEVIRKSTPNILTLNDIETKGKELLDVAIEDKITSNSYFINRPNVIIVGGTAYNLADNLYPNQEKNRLITLNFGDDSANDIEMYRNLITSGEVIIPEHLKYTPKQLLAGLIIIENIFEATNAREAYYQDQISWMPGFIRYKINQK